MWQWQTEVRIILRGTESDKTQAIFDEVEQL